MKSTPREVITPFRPLPLTIPEGMGKNEFFNSSNNLKNLTEENGLLRTRENFLLYRKAIGHSLEFDTSIIFDTSQTILDPLGRPVRRDQLSKKESRIWSRMSQTIVDYMLEQYPDPEKHLVFCGEASLDPTWPINKPGVPSIRMIHNHFIVYPQEQLRQAKIADSNHPNLTDGGHHGLFLKHLGEVYQRFFEILNLTILQPISSDKSQLALTGYPQGLPSWEVTGGADSLKNPRFWQEYDLILKGFLDFYRTFFGLVATQKASIPKESYFPDQVENVLLFNNDFYRVAREVRLKVIDDPQFANEMRWHPAYKQLMYRDCKGRLIVTISQNSVGNAITELLGIVVKRIPDTEAYNAAEPALLAKLFEVCRRLIASDLGEPISNGFWPIQDAQTLED
ncbi:MAG: hypothetical protein HQL72_05820 [Magnetococcales bacterium]|nr:hypothetical protein [Magnetococcales bacterium]